MKKNKKEELKARRCNFLELALHQIHVVECESADPEVKIKQLYGGITVCKFFF